MEKIKNLLKNNYDKSSKSVNTITSLFRETSESMSDPAFRKQVERSGFRPSAGPKNYTKRKKAMNPNLLNVLRNK